MGGGGTLAAPEQNYFQLVQFLSADKFGQHELLGGEGMGGGASYWMLFCQQEEEDQKYK